MSLFGGSFESSPASSETTPRPVPSPTSKPQLPDQGPLDLSDDEDEYYDHDGDEDVAKDSPPNRYCGEPSTWKQYTRVERQTAASLVQLESEDLAAHLYNAHALKRRSRLPDDDLATFETWRSKDSWLKPVEQRTYTDPAGDVQTDLLPTKLWTAWPFPPATITALSERFSPSHSDVQKGEWVAGCFGEQSAGGELREEMLAVFLRLAKEQWKARQQDNTPVNLEPKARMRHRSKSVKSVPSASSGASTDQSDDEAVDSNDQKTDTKPSGNEPDEKFADLLGKKQRRKRSRVAFSRPVLSADDDKARRILEPTINSLLSQIDDLGGALRRNRLNHFGRGAHNDTSGSEAVSDVDSVLSDSTSMSRSRSKSVSKTRPTTRNSSDARSRSKGPSKSRQSRRKQQGPSDVDSDSASDYGAEYEKRARVRSTSRKGTFRSHDTEFQKSLMDWSEVLGAASTVGISEQAIARTAQRCASLFGEGMAFRPFVEGLAISPLSDAVHYTPATIPPPDIFGRPSAQPAKRPYFQKGTLHCPHTDCRGHEEAFEIPYRVVEHVKRVHGYDPRTNNADNQELRSGGVHIDGFLQPIYAKQGWLGKGRAKSDTQRPRKRRTKQESESAPASPEDNVEV